MNDMSKKCNDMFDGVIQVGGWLVGSWSGTCVMEWHMCDGVARV